MILWMLNSLRPIVLFFLYPYYMNKYIKINKIIYIFLVKYVHILDFIYFYKLKLILKIFILHFLRGLKFDKHPINTLSILNLISI